MAFREILSTDKQTDGQTDTDAGESISSLAR